MHSPYNIKPVNNNIALLPNFAIEMKNIQTFTINCNKVITSSVLYYQVLFGFVITSLVLYYQVLFGFVKFGLKLCALNYIRHFDWFH